MPKLFNTKVILTKSHNSTPFLFWSLHLILPKLFLWKFILNPKTNSNNLKITLMVRIFLIFVSPTKIMSSTYCKRHTSHSYLSIKYPLNKFFPFACLIKPFNPSTVTKKGNEAKGSPCGSPLWHLNSCVGFHLPTPKPKKIQYIFSYTWSCIMETQPMEHV